MRRTATSIGVLAAMLVLSACGSDTSGGGAMTRSEPADAPAALPHGWRRVINRHAGFSLAIPPGWKPRAATGVVLVRSPDRALAVSIGADRSSGSRTTQLDRYARQAIQSLPGYRELRVGLAKQLAGTRYPTSELSATGRFTRTGVAQEILLVAARAGSGVTLTEIFFRSIRAPARRYAKAIDGIVRTLRAGRPDPNA